MKYYSNDRSAYFLTTSFRIQAYKKNTGRELRNAFFLSDSFVNSSILMYMLYLGKYEIHILLLRLHTQQEQLSS